MDEIIDEIKGAYLEEFTVLFAPKIAIFTAFFMICIASWNSSNGLWGNLWLSNLTSFFDFSNGPISQVLVRDFMVSAMAAYVTHYSYQSIKKTSFSLIGKMMNLENRINSRIRDSNQLKSKNEAINLFMVKEVQKEIEEKEKKLYRYHSIGVFSMAILIASASAFTFALLKGFFEGKLFFFQLDLIASFASLAIILLVQERAAIYFLKNMMPLIIIEKALLGSRYDLN